MKDLKSAAPHPPIQELPGSEYSGLRASVLLLRPQQWTKNLLVLAALLFAGQAHVPRLIYRSFLAFAAFCLVSGAVYVVNDLLDRDADRAHPRKRHRPIASGKITPATAILIAAVSLAAGLAMMWATSPGAFACLCFYLLLQAVYTTVLKHVVILDVMSIAAGFVLRAVAGAYAIDVLISPWLLICSILLALFLALSKRRSELLSSNEPQLHRRVLGDYSLAFLDQLIAIVTSCTVLSYILYTFSEQTMRKFSSHMMPLTAPFVLYGIFRYLYLTHLKSGGSEPEIMLIKDVPLLVNILLWALTVALIVSLG